ncbi:MAG: CRISPR-associated endonuclease Cas1 [Intestinibaculum porci]|uniref:CRISPR-associated endonuclease Cas1 n=1 Tax=Intestinibaculum porci TaxID=2487118 RepID=UPI003F07D1EF
MKKLLNTLYILDNDKYLSLDGENIVIIQDKSELGRVPLHNIESIITAGYTGVSPALMGKCVHDHIQLLFISRSGRLLARVTGGPNGNVLLRREQYRIADEKEASVKYGRNMIAAKLYNSASVVDRCVRDHALRVNVELLRNTIVLLRDQANLCLETNNIDSLRGIEGEAANQYFSVFDQLILQSKDDFKFLKRTKRPPLDNVNALLSFAYTLLAGMYTSALESVGLDLYVGFVHIDRPGRESLALDMMEELRSPFADRFVLTLINNRFITKDNFDLREDGAVLLNDG